MRPGSSERARWLASHILPHEAALRGWLRRTGLDQGVAQDVVQESYCQLLSLTSLSGISNGRAYFFKIARNIVLQRLRRERIVKFEAFARIEDVVFADPAPDVVDVLSDREQLDVARRLIMDLPERCRDIFILRKIEGLSQRDTARRLGVSENVVEKQLARGLTLLLERMAERGFERAAKSERTEDEAARLRHR
jgi:RNA polymerase sigma-70 factor (ECF subfamily)